jgi:VanZ family protein
MTLTTRMPGFPAGSGRARLALRCASLLLATGILLVLLYFGAQAAAGGPIATAGAKLAHAGIFGIFTALLWFATAGRMPLTVVAVLVGVAALDELHQARLPGGTADAVDFLVDICAGAAAIGIITLFASARRERRSTGSLPPRKRRAEQRRRRD